jgi:hypothetical protein
MHAVASPRLWSFSRGEWLFLLAAIAGWGLLAVLLGKDVGWDFLNYHWYTPYALLNGRLGFDVAVAHQATYFNPLIHLPFYLLATLGTSWVALFYLGALQGLNVIPLYWMSRSALSPSSPRWSAIALPLIGMAGSTVVSMIRKTSYDQSLLSALVLGGLALVIVGRRTLQAPTRAATGLAVLSGLLVGLAVGLKPAEGPYGVGIALALLVPAGSLGTRVARLAAGALGGVSGILLAGGTWFVMLAHYSGNPLFPFFNGMMHSALIGGGSFLDSHFIPQGWWAIISFPIRFAIHYGVADDVPFRDLRLPFLYLLIPLACVLWLCGRRAQAALVWPEVALILFAFCAASYAAWLRELAIYRYIVALEMLAPLVIAAAVGLLPLSLRARIAFTALLLAVSAALGRYAPGPYAPLGDPYVQLSPLSIPRPEQTMILMTGYEPMAYIIPSLPASIPVLRIQGWLVEPGDGSGLSEVMRERVAAYTGELFLLASPLEREEALKATAALHLRIEIAGCQQLKTNLGGPYEFCPLRALEPASASPASLELSQ